MEDMCFGGTQKQILELASRLDRQKFDPLLLTLTGRTDLDRVAENANIPLLHLTKSRKIAPLFFARLPRLLKKAAPDVLVPCTALPNIWGRIWGRLLKIPVIVGTCRGGGAPRRQHERFLWRLCDRIICNSTASVTDMRSRGVPLERLAYIPNGVDTDYYRPQRRTRVEPCIVCVARLARDKDLPTLLRAFSRVRAEIPDARLRLVGEGPEGKNLARLADRELEPQVRECVEFAGASADTRPHYADADVFALSSIREGQPNVILEAMASGLPVCATSVGGIPALVENGATGLLSPPGSVESMAANLVCLLKNRKLAMEMGDAGRKRVESGFSFQAMVKSHEQLFSTLWGARRQQSPGENL